MKTSIITDNFQRTPEMKQLRSPPGASRGVDEGVIPMKRIRATVVALSLVASALSATAIVSSPPASAAPPTAGAPIFIAGDVQHKVDVFNQAGAKVDDWDANFTTNDRLAVGDVTGDGIDEVLIGGDVSHIVDIFDQSGIKLRSFNGNYTLGDGFAVGDVTGDSKAEIVIAGDASGTIDIFDQFGNRPVPAYNGNFTAGDGLAVGDVDGSDKAEIVIGGDASGIVDIFDAAGNRPWPAFDGNFTAGDGFGIGKVGGGPSENIVIAGDISGTVDVFNVAGTKINSFAGNYTNNDALGIGDVTGDGTDEIVIGGDVSGTVDIFDRFGGRPVPAFNGNYTSGDGLAVGNATYPDADADGLLDSWEINGFDADGNGSIDINLPGMGARFNHKDIFLEFDWVTGQNPNQAAITAMKQAFAAAPVNAGGTNNPDGQPGITLHVDTGSLTDPTASEDGGPANSCSDGIIQGGDGQADAADPSCLVGDNLGGGNDVGNVNVLPLDSSFYNTKATNFNSNRKYIFRYGMSGDPTDNNPRTGGRGEIGGNDFIEYNHDGGTIMHELGHNLNLRHGGNQDNHCKPNYVSVMNYDLQFGIPQAGGGAILDYSPPRHAAGRGTAPLATIKEDNLDDNIIFDSTDATNRFVFKSGMNRVQNPLNTTVNWAGDVDPPRESDNTVNVDTSILAGTPPVQRPAACQNSATDSTLTGHDDWSVIAIPFRQFGDSDDSAINPETDLVPTLEDRDAMLEAINTTDVGVTVSDSPDPVAAGTNLTYTFDVNNYGPNPSSKTRVTTTLPTDVTFASSSVACTSVANTLTCDLGELLTNTARSFTVTVSVAADAVFVNGGPKDITNTTSVANLSGPDPVTANNNASTSTQVVAVADLAVLGSSVVSPPTEVLIGNSVPVTVRSTVNNGGPSAPINATVTNTASASSGSSVTPPAPTAVAALELNTPRVIDSVFTLECAAPGSHTYTFDTSITPANAVDTDPDASNNTATSSVTVDCVVPVAINIKPGGSPNSINRNGANVPLAVLTTNAGEYGLPLAFDAVKIDPLTVRFGTKSVLNSGGGSYELHARGHIERSIELDEYTNDSDLDMVLHHPPSPASGLMLSTTTACVKGEFTSGTTRYRFFGCDAVRIVK